MKTDFNVTDYAVYLPAINDTYARCLVTEKLGNRPFPAGLGIEDLEYWNESNKLWRYPYLLHSIGNYQVGANPDNAVTRADRKTAIVIGDSGGYQIGQGSLKGYDALTPHMPAADAIAAWDAADDVRNWIFGWLEANSSYAMSIDMPLWAAEEKTNSPFSNCSREQLLQMTVNNLQFIDVRRQGHTKWLNVVQGIDNAATEQWWNAVKKYRWGGWALAGGAGSKGGLAQLLYAVLLMRDEGAFAEGLDWLHTLGVSQLKWAVILTAIQKNLRNLNPKLTISFDTSSVFQQGMRRENAYVSPVLTNNANTWVLPSESSPQSYKKIGSTDPFPFSSAIGDKMTVGHLNVQDWDAFDKRQYDNVSLLLLSNHNIWVTLDAVQRANESAFSANRDDKTPNLYIDCIDLIGEAFAASDWRGFIQKNKSTFDAHSRSIYAK
jgi:hypothetical protein